MIKLPPEIFNLIFLLLIQRDKLECMTVCRQWHDTIRDHSLFRNIYLQSQRQLDKLIEKVKGVPALGESVVQLKLHFKLDWKYDDTIFVKLFPNFREFSMVGADDFSSDAKLVTPYQNHPWCKYIKKMVEKGSNLNTRILLNSGMCKNLIHISVSEANGRLHRFIEVLVNAPALKKLKLECCKVSFPELELLHTNVPALNSLTLRFIKFDSSTIPLKIKPATSMKCFRLSYCFFRRFPDRSQYRLYIRQKYTYLKELSLELEPIVPSENNNINLAREQRTLMTSYLTTLGLRLKNCSLLLPGLSADHFATTVTFDMFDESGCQIEALTLGYIKEGDILERLSKCGQIQYIRSLTLDGIYVKSDILISFKCFKYFIALKELSLCFYDPESSTLNLTYLLNNLVENQLETLTISYTQLESNGSLKAFAYPSIKYLILLEIVYFNEPDIGDTISHAFPNLKGLKLHNYIQGMKTIRMSMTELSYLEILHGSPEKPLCISVNTLGNDQKRLYTTYQAVSELTIDKWSVKGNMLSVPYMSSKPYDSLNDTPLLKFICKSAHNLLLIKTYPET